MARIKLDLPRAEALADRAVRGGVRSVLGAAERILKSDILTRPGTGKVYRRGGKTHQASAPGQPPAPDIGNLVANTNASTDLEIDGDDVVGDVVAATKYAEALHTGTERMAARPFFNVLTTDFRRDLEAAFHAGAKE